MSKWPDGFVVRFGKYRHKVTGSLVSIVSADFCTGIIELESKVGGIYSVSAESFQIGYEEVAE